MGLSTAEIEELYASHPLIRPPGTIYVLRNQRIRAERLHEAAHRFNSVQREGRYQIFGMTRPGSGWFIMAADGRPSTPLHEALHGMGARSESLTHALTALVQARPSLGLFRQSVKYTETTVPDTEKAAILKDMNLSNPNGEPVDMVRLDLVQPGEIKHDLVYSPD